MLAARKDTAPSHIYVGLRSRVIAELGTPDYYEGKYLIAPYGDGVYDAEGCKTLRETREIVALWKRDVPGIQVVWLC